MKRGDVVVVALPGDFGKPRPAIVVQSDALGAIDSVIVCPLTTHLESASDFRPMIPIEPRTGLRRPSRIMTDKITAVTRAKCSAPIGILDAMTLEHLTEALAMVLGFTGP